MSDKTPDPKEPGTDRRRRGRSGETGAIIDRALLVLIPLILAVCLFELGSYLIDIWREEWKNAQLASQYSAASRAESTVSQADPVVLPQFEDLLDQNEDTVGWISIDGTPVNYVVVQSEDNDYYLRRAFDGSSSRGGTIFLDYRCKIWPKSRNLLLFGHNMKNTTMFSSLDGYTDVAYYREHPIIRFDTIYEQAEYVIFAVVLMDASPAEKNDDEFSLTIFSETEDTSFVKYLKLAERCTLIKTGIDVKADDKLVTLLTCAYTYNGVTIEDARYCILARQLRSGETAESFDFSAAVQNPSPLLPAAYR